MAPNKTSPGIRTRLLLQISVTLIIAATMTVSGLMVRSRLRQHVQEILQEDLRHSMMTFKDLQARRRESLERENGLLATLPTLRNLMATHEAETIAAGAQDLWKLSGNAIFGLADADGNILAADALGAPNHRELHDELQTAMQQPAKHYLLAGGNLYEYTISPIRADGKVTSHLLGYVIGGYAVDQRLLREVGRGAGAEAISLVNNKVTVSTLPKEQLTDIAAGTALTPGSRNTVRIGSERYLTYSRDLSAQADVPLRLALLQSSMSADRTEREILRIVLMSSVMAICVGCALMLVLARNVTAPLERLADAVKAFAGGDREYRLPAGGPREVRYLSAVLAEMRDEIQRKNQALLESERLATIGRMAGSVSHDLRHYLAAVYANSEFLASPTLPAEERAELLEEIRLAVNGTTDMLDALLLFGSTGATLRREPTPMSAVVERAVALVRTHPDAAHVAVTTSLTHADTTADIDTRQMERAVYNLLLNACQSAREGDGAREVEAAVRTEGTIVVVAVRDTGAGVPDGIRHSLFDPFVSRGKQKGTGLGLTLAHSVAREHNGDVVLQSSRRGETIFRLTVEASRSVRPASIALPAEASLS